MGKISYGGILPHPPLIIDEIGKKEAEKIARTKAESVRISQIIKELEPDTIVLISPHAAVFGNAVSINTLPNLQGSFRNFGFPGIKYEAVNDVELVQKIILRAAKSNIPIAQVDGALAQEYGVSAELDHGVLVPWSFLESAGVKAKLVQIGIGFLPLEELYLFGNLLQEVIEDMPRNAVVIASSDLSHRLNQLSPYGFHEAGAIFDRSLQEALSKLDIKGLLSIPAEILEQAGECGYRSIIMMLGALDGRKVTPTLYSYEGPFGIGYLTAGFEPGTEEKSRALIQELFQNRAKEIEKIKNKESSVVSLARLAISTYLITGEVIISPNYLKVPEGLPTKAATFVSLHKYGQLRGCMGTFKPTQGDITDEIVQNAINAALEDPRFKPVTLEELKDLIITVDVLSKPEKIKTVYELNPKKYGVIVSQGEKAGLLLPDLAGIEDPLEQVALAKQKAGITAGEVTLERFTVTRYN